MRDGRAVRLWVVGVTVVAVGAMVGWQHLRAQQPPVPPECKCTHKGHEPHDNLVTVLTFKPKGAPRERDDLSGSVVWLCRHRGTALGRDRVAWNNIRKGGGTIEVKFDRWPFELPVKPIIVPAGEVSEYFTVGDTVKSDVYWYKVLYPSSAGKSATVAMTELVLQPGPAVVVDN